eukprot:2186090-Amphidinium_carterae.1
MIVMLRDHVKTCLETLDHNSKSGLKLSTLVGVRQTTIDDKKHDIIRHEIAASEQEIVTQQLSQ